MALFNKYKFKLKNKMGIKSVQKLKKAACNSRHTKADYKPLYIDWTETKSRPPSLIARGVSKLKSTPPIPRPPKEKKRSVCFVPFEVYQRPLRQLESVENLQVDDIKKRMDILLFENKAKVYKVLADDTKNHIANMLAAYDIYNHAAMHKHELKGKEKEKSDRFMDEHNFSNSTPDEDEAVEKAEKKKKDFKKYYSDPLENQFDTGVQIARNIKLRVTNSVDRMEDLENFYYEILAFVSPSPPPRPDFCRIATECEFVKRLLSEEVLLVMKNYGIEKRANGTLFERTYI